MPKKPVAEMSHEDLTRSARKWAKGTCIALIVLIITNVGLGMAFGERGYRDPLVETSEEVLAHAADVIEANKALSDALGSAVDELRACSALVDSLRTR